MRRSPPPEAERGRVRTGLFASHADEGNNGVFLLDYPGGTRSASTRNSRLRVMVSDGYGWEHASISVHGEPRCPTWDEMCWVKDIFWRAEERVVQFHPPRSEYVNCRPYMLHLWRPTDSELPAPPPIMVGARPNSDAARELVELTGGPAPVEATPRREP